MPEIPCPSCGRSLPPGGALVCPACDLALTGPAAVRLWEVDQTIASLTAERADLLVALRTAPSGAPVEIPAPTRSAATAPGTAPALGTAPAPAAPTTWTGQRLLLSVGVLLVLVASAVFLAVAWTLIGVAGQVGVMAVLTGCAAYASLRLSRRGLRSTAEAFAVLTGGLMIVDVAAARSLGLAGLDGTDLRHYGIAAGLLTAAALAALHLRDRRVRASGLLALVAASGALVSGAALVDTLAGESAVLAAGALGFAALAIWLPPSAGALRTAAGGPAVGWSGVAGLMAAAAAIDPVTRGATSAPVRLSGQEALALGVLATLVGVGAAVVVLVVRSRARAEPTGSVREDWSHRFWAARWRAVTLAALEVTLLAPVLVLAVATQTRGPGSGLLAALLAAAVGVVGWRAAGTLRPTALWAESITVMGVLACGWVAWAGDARVSLMVAVTSLAAALTTVALAHRPLRAFAGGAAALTTGYAVWLAGDLVGTGVGVAAVAVAVAGIAALAAAQRGLAEEPALGLAATILLVADVAVAVDQEWLLTAAALLGFGAALAVAYSWLPGRRDVTLLGAFSLVGAVWTVLVDQDVQTLEAYTLSLAAVALATGLRVRRAGSPSWLTVGPAAAAALIPSALASLGDDGLVRPLVTVVAAAAALALGVQWRWQALVVTGASAGALVALGQLGPYAVGAPRWLTLGVTGAVLLALGMRYEERRADARRAAHWLGGLG